MSTNTAEHRHERQLRDMAAQQGLVLAQSRSLATDYALCWFAYDLDRVLLSPTCGLLADELEHWLEERKHAHG